MINQHYRWINKHEYKREKRIVIGGAQIVVGVTVAVDDFVSGFFVDNFFCAERRGNFVKVSYDQNHGRIKYDQVSNEHFLSRYN